MRCLFFSQNRRPAAIRQVCGYAEVGRLGDRVALDLEEMGASGEYQLMSIEPAPAIPAGPAHSADGLATSSVQFAISGLAVIPGIVLK